MSDRLSEVLGLHQSVRVIYVVDCFEATLYADDDESEVIATANGFTVVDAVENLSLTLEGKAK